MKQLWINKYLKSIKQIFILACCVFFLACDELKKKEGETPENKTEVNSLHLDLKSQLGYGSFLPNREILFPLNRSISFQGVPDYINTYVVRSFVLQKHQDYYNQFKRGEISEERFQQIKTIFNIDVEKLSDENPKTDLLFLLGTDQAGNRVIIPDSNQNFDFSDDEPLQFEFPLEFIDEEDEEFFEENQEQFLPKAKFKIDYVKDAKVEKREVILVVNPYQMETEVSFYSENPAEKDYFIAVSFPKVMKSNFDVANQSYQVEVANQFLQPFYLKEETKLNFFRLDEEQKNPINKRPYSLGDTININQYDFKIESLSEDGGKLHLNYLGRNENPIGSRMGNYFPLNELANFQGEKTTFPSTEKQFQLLYFWSLDEKRSLREVPDLKEIDTSKVAVLGFSVDENAGAANRMQVRRKMDWPTFHLHPNKNIKELDRLQLEAFPTYFLLDQEGKILLRSLHLSEIKRKLY